MTDENVTPIVPSHVCASCKATITTLDVYEGHMDSCMQPEIRMRRLEASVRELVDSIAQLKKEAHGSSEVPTQRSGGTTGLGHDWARPVYVIDDNGKPVRYASDYEISVFARCAGGSRSNTSPAEPAGEAPTGAVSAPGGPERTG